MASCSKNCLDIWSSSLKISPCLTASFWTKLLEDLDIFWSLLSKNSPCSGTSCCKNCLGIGSLCSTNSPCSWAPSSWTNFLNYAKYLKLVIKNLSVLERFVLDELHCHWSLSQLPRFVLNKSPMLALLGIFVLYEWYEC